MPALEPPLFHVDSTTGVDPFLKWPGGKRWLIRRGLNVPLLDEESTYFEPFLGAGSLFFALQPRRASLSDVNPHLVACYRGLRSTTARVVRKLESLENEPQTFERMRRSSPNNQLDRSIRFLYLNRTAYSGIYRENQLGNFNVPFGHYYDRRICNEMQLRRAAKALKSARLKVGDFRARMSEPKGGDFVYLDPPYISGHQNNGFVRYNRRLFNWDNQVELAEMATELVDRGVHVLISNAAHTEVLKLYKDFFVDIVIRKNQISRDPARRGLMEEAVISSYRGAVS
jgi:DNA adenine methylase